MASRRPALVLQGRAAIVTGAASGIGLALARALAERGAHLALADVDAPGLHAVGAELAASGTRVVTRVVDVSSEQEVEAAAAAFAGELGPVHLLFNNAGVDASGALQDLSMQQWQRAFGINVFGVAHGLRHFLPLLQQHGERAHVVNTASAAGFWTNPESRMGAYAASKSAVVAISEALEQELAGTPVGVSVLCPGPVATAFAKRSPGASAGFRARLAAGISPEAVTALVLDAIERDAFYVFTPTRMAGHVQARTARILEALARVVASDPPCLTPPGPAA